MDRSTNPLYSNEHSELLEALLKASPNLTEFHKMDNYFEKWTMLIPFKYEAYCKIFHTIFKSNIDYKNETWQSTEKKNSLPTNPIEEVLATSTLVSGSFNTEERRTSTRISWKQLSEEIGLVYGPRLTAYDFDNHFDKIGLKSWPRDIERPAEGYWTMRELVKIFNKIITRYKNIFIWTYYDTLKIIAHHKEFGIDIFVDHDNKLEKFKSYDTQKIRNLITPDLMFDFDRSFCFYIDYDQSFTLLGASREFIDDFINSEELECVEFSENSLIALKTSIA